MTELKQAFREKVLSGEVLYGSMLSMIRNPRWVSVIKELHFDFICIDNEHSPYSQSEIADLIAVFGNTGIPTLVRVPLPAWYHVAGVFDAGAWGVLAPYCETVEQAKEVVRAARWRPLKGRYVQKVMDEGEFPSEETRRHLQEYNAGHVVIIGIESVPAVENLERILDVGGIDAVFIGPADISTSMGIPRQYDQPDFDKMLRQIIQSCRRRKVQLAANFQQPEHSAKWANEGINMVIHSTDFRMLHEAYRRDFEQISGAVKGDRIRVIAETEKDI